MKKIVLLLIALLAVGCSKSEEKPNYSEISGAYSKDFGTGNGNIWLWIQSSGNFELKSTYASGKESVFKGRIIKKDGDSYLGNTAFTDTLLYRRKNELYLGNIILARGKSDILITARDITGNEKSERFTIQVD